MKKQLLTILALVFTLSLLAQNPQRDAALKLKQEEMNLKSKNSLNTNGIKLNNSTVIGKTTNKPMVISGTPEYDLVKKEGRLAHYEVRMGSDGKLYKVNMAANTTTATTPCDYIPYVGTALSFTSSDDANTGIALPFTFCFYGANYTSCNISINGNIQFSTNSTAFSSTGFPSTAVNMIAPFWADCYLTSGSSVKVDMYTNHVVISWDSLGYFSNHNDKTNSFQCVLSDGTSTILPPGKNVGFYYKKMQWTTGDASDGVGGFPDPLITPSIPATIGINQGNGIDYYLVGRFGQNNANYDGPLGADDGISWLNGKRFYFNACPPIGINLEPVATLIGYCDTLKVCGNDTLYIKNTFIGPELTQTVSVVVTATPTGTNTALGSSFSYSNIPGPNSSTDVYMVVNANTAPAGSSGYHTITMTATDNGSPAQTSVQTFVVYLDQISTNNLTGNIVMSPACPGSIVTASITVSGGVVGNYLWSNNSSGATTTYSAVTGADSLVFVTITSGQCKKTFSDYLHVKPQPVANISGNLFVCSGSNPTTILTANNTLNSAAQAPYTYTWTGTNPLSSTNTATTSVGSGVYTVTITNQYGCKSVATRSISLNEGPVYNITTNATSNGSVYCTSLDTARLAFHYLTSPSPACGSGFNNCVTSTIVQTGTAITAGSATAYNPYAGLWESSHHQYLYRASDLIAAGVQAGKLSSLAFNITNLNGGNTSYSSFTVKIKCTNDNVLNTTSMDYANLVQVYTAPVTNVAAGWNTYNFSQPYLWDGASNILVDICYNEPNWVGSNTVQYTNVGYNCVKYDYWFTDVCGDTFVSGNSQNRPNIRFGNCLSQQLPSQFNVVVTPSVGVVIPATKDSIKIDLPNVTSTTCYTISVINPIGGCTKDTIICVRADQGLTMALFSANPSTVCVGTPVVLSASNADTYTMSYIQGGVPVQLTTNDTYTHVPVQAGLNIYTLTAVGFCGAAPAGYTVGVNVIPVANLTITPLQDVTKCLNKPFVLTTAAGSSTSGNSGTPYNYSWTTLPGNNPAPGTNNGSAYTVNSNATTTLVVTATGNCASTVKDTVVVKNFIDDLSVSIPDSLTVCPNKEFTGTAQVSGGYPNYTYTWYLSNNPISNSSDLVATSPQDAGFYYLDVTVKDSCGYIKNDVQVVSVSAPCDVIIPNVITANGDGVNDVFKIKNIEFHPNTVVTVFDRWGRKVYENSNYQNDWKADNVSDGTFFYVIDVPDDKKYNGFITIFHGK